MDLIKDGTIMPIANKIEYKYDATRIRTISGQVDQFGRENGLVRVEWSAGDIYEG